MKLYFFLLFCFLSAQSILGQCKLTIIQEGKKCNLINQLLVANYPDIKPVRINDSTLEFTYYPTEPQYLFIFVDKQRHGDTSLMYNWRTRLWIAPKIKRRELIINYTAKTVKVRDVGVNNLHKWDSIAYITGQLDDSGKFTKEQKVITSYIEQHPSSYLSLWFFGYSHALGIESDDTQLTLFNKLNPILKEYSDYQKDYYRIQADFARKFPNPGDAFKEFALTDIRGKVFNSTTIKNKWILLHFWSNACGPCINEMDAMVSYYKTLDTSKIAFISICLDDDSVQWKRAVTSHKIKWTNLWEPGGTYGNLCLNYNLQAMPFFVLFNNKKKLVVMQDGANAIKTTLKGCLSKVK